MAVRRRFTPLLLAVVVGGCVVAVPAASSPTASAPPPSHPSAEPSGASPTAAPTDPAPSATPNEALLELEALGCPGGVVLEWSPTTHPAFHHYTALRSPQSEIAPDYPPIAPAVDWGRTYATDRFVTSAVDASILPSATRWNYRVMAYAVDGVVVSASPVRSARLSPVVDLGQLRANPAADGGTRLEWHAFTGFSGCFSFYRVTFGAGGPPATELSIVSDQAAGSLRTDALHAGATYQLQVEAVRVTTLGSFVAGRSAIATYTVP